MDSNELIQIARECGFWGVPEWFEHNAERFEKFAQRIEQPHTELIDLLNKKIDWQTKAIANQAEQLTIAKQRIAQLEKDCDILQTNLDAAHTINKNQIQNCEAAYKYAFLDAVPVAIISGIYAGHPIFTPTDHTVIFPVGMALYAQPPRQIDAETRRLVIDALKSCDEAMEYMSEYDISLSLPAKVKAALEKLGAI